MSAIAELLDECRRHLDRVRARPGRRDRGRRPLIDTRPADQREREGQLAGARVVDRNVLEWRLDPTSSDRLPEATSSDLRVIVVGSEGYSSSLAAHTLRSLGLHRATDLVGGCQAWLQEAPAMTSGCATGQASKRRCRSA